jgi:hypothetical protein
MTRLSDEGGFRLDNILAPVRMDGHFQEREEGPCPTWGAVIHSDARRHGRLAARATLCQFTVARERLFNALGLAAA